MEMTDRNWETTVKLRCGRKLGYAEWGPSGGTPVLLFHGTPGSRLFRIGDDRLYEELKIRLYALERPGYGISDPHPGRTIIDYAQDVENFADILGMDNIRIIGYSGGGPFALACAQKMKNRVKRLSVVCGSDPPSDPVIYAGLSGAAKRFVDLVAVSPQAAVNAAINLVAHPEKLSETLLDNSSPEDKAVYSQPEIHTLQLANFIEGIRESPHGYEFAFEFLLLFSDWGFDISEIETAVNFWYGGKDRNEFHSSNRGKYMASKIKKSRLKIFEDEGSAILWSHADEILRSILL